MDTTLDEDTIPVILDMALDDLQDTLDLVGEDVHIPREGDTTDAL